MKSLITIPVYNEEKYLANVLVQVLAHHSDVLVIDDGSTDRTPELLERFSEVKVLRHSHNRGYGAALRHAFSFGCENDYEVIVTLDSDGQHAPSMLPQFLAECQECQIVSGSRYLKSFAVNTAAPAERRRINRLVTDELNACLGLGITDAFCGFKAYRTEAIRKMSLSEDGYGMPLELWVQAALAKLRIQEIAVPCVYLDPARSFSETLDDSSVRLAYYQRVIDKAFLEARGKFNDQHMRRTPNPVFQKVD